MTSLGGLIRSSRFVYPIPTGSSSQASWLQDPGKVKAYTYVFSILESAISRTGHFLLIFYPGDLYTENLDPKLKFGFLR